MEKSKIFFRALTFNDIPLMWQWFNAPHVQAFYSLRSWTLEEVSAKLTPSIAGEKPLFGFIILLNAKPIGYLQSYKVSDYPWPNQDFSEEIIKNAMGMDLFIGEKAYIHKGLGAQIIQEFINSYIYPQYLYCIVDPSTNNEIAIQCYEKLKFKEHQIINTKDALERPTQLKLMILKCAELRDIEAIENSDFNEEIIQWGNNFLLSEGYLLNTDLPEIVQNTPWSYVVRFATNKGYFYLKQTPKLLALEAIITKILYDQFDVSVPEIIAHNAELHCFIMKDAGLSLRSVLKKQFDAELLGRAIIQFTSVQLIVSEHIALFLDIGVPDYRLDKLPTLYQQLLSEKNLLMEDGLSEIDISQLETLVPKVSDLCKKLSNFSIKETFVQPDFHDNNILIKEESKKFTMIDLGEIVISHPFFSLVGCLKQAKRHYFLKKEDKAYQKLIDACVKNYTIFEPKKNLLETLALAELLWPIYSALAHYRFMLACDKTRLILFQGRGRLSGYLKEFSSAF